MPSQQCPTRHPSHPRTLSECPVRSQLVAVRMAHRWMRPHQNPGVMWRCIIKLLIQLVSKATDHAMPRQSIQCQPAAFQLPRSHNNSSTSITVSDWLILSSYSIKKPITQPASGKVHFILMPFSTNPHCGGYLSHDAAMCPTTCPMTWPLASS